MTLLEEFIEKCLTPKERLYLSEPMNTKHEAMFKCFVIGREL